MDVLGWLGFRSSEKRVYGALSGSNKAISIKEITKKTGMSERSVRDTLKVLLKKKFVRRKITKGKRLMYKYEALPVKSAWGYFKDKVDRVLGKK